MFGVEGGIKNGGRSFPRASLATAEAISALMGVVGGERDPKAQLGLP